MKRVLRYLSAAFLVLAVTVLASCASGNKVIFVLPEGATGIAPKAQSYETYAQVTLPSIDSTLNGNPQSGWKDVSGNYFANGATFAMGSMDVTFTAVYDAQVVAESFCENPGTMNFGGRLIGPTAAYTIFLSDKTWTADAEGVACFSHFEGTWDLTDDGNLSMTLVEQDGVQRNTPVEITDDGRSFTYTLTHPGDRGGLKYHVNHITAYELMSGLNKLGDSYTVPEAPVFELTLGAGTPGGGGGGFGGFGGGAPAAPAVEVSGETPSVSGAIGEAVVLPECGYSCEGFTFGGWTYDGTTYQPGETFTILPADLTLNASWVKNS